MPPAGVGPDNFLEAPPFRRRENHSSLYCHPESNKASQFVDFTPLPGFATRILRRSVEAVWSCLLFISLQVEGLEVPTLFNQSFSGADVTPYARWGPQTGHCSIAVPNLQQCTGRYLLSQRMQTDVEISPGFEGSINSSSVILSRMDASSCQICPYEPQEPSVICRLRSL